jgi:gamma-glutamyltranspeptidase/glutathione hydrolase
VLSEEDFKRHHSDWGAPISTEYRGYRIYQTPPNTQGIAALLGFNILEGFDVKALGHNSAEYFHHFCEAKKLAFRDRDRYVTDPEFAEIPLERLLDKQYAGTLRSMIDPHKATISVDPSFDSGGDTIYFTVVDGEGNIVSCIQSLYFSFGSGLIAEGTGIAIHNRGAYFSLDPNHVNVLEPGKRTMHTLIASIAFDQNMDPCLVFGSMGGDGQPQIHMSVMTNILDFGMNIQEAIDAPRWMHGKVWIEDPKVQLNVEGRVPRSVVEELKQMGHEVYIMEDWTRNVGHAQGILIDRQTGVLQGGADPRGDGYALGW